MIVFFEDIYLKILWINYTKKNIYKWCFIEEHITHGAQKDREICKIILINVL